MDCSSPGFSVLRISQARILEWVVISSSKGSCQPRHWTHASCIAGRFFTTEPPGKPSGICCAVLSRPVVSDSLWPKRKWQPTPVLLPGKSHGRRILVGYSLWGCKESDTTKWLHFGLLPTRLLCPWGFSRQEDWSGLLCPPPNVIY